VKGKRRIFNDTISAAPNWHPQWTWPLTWPGAERPKLGPGEPSLIFVGDMSDLFHEDRSKEIIDRVCATIALSDHVGLLLTKRAMRMREYFTATPPRTVRRWQRSMWLGFSAENQDWFDCRWADMRPLADAEWFVFVSIAPMIGPVMLPEDFLALGPRVWVIVAGEQGPHDRCRYMDPGWARSVRDQCARASIPFFMKQMAKGAPIPPDLQTRELPSVGDRIFCLR
jgi:protein gp37